MTSLFERLNDNEIILLDGRVSIEIQKRGVAMDSDVWSGLAHKSHPEVVLQVHEDYIRAGAQVITANTYSTARHVLESIDLGGEVRAINSEAVQLGIMHSQVRDTPPALEILGRHWSGPKLAYAETGEIEKPDWNFKEICTPNEYAAELEGWINNYGVQIIGGFCGTGPEHIRILKQLLPQHLPV